MSSLRLLVQSRADLGGGKQRRIYMNPSYPYMVSDHAVDSRSVCEHAVSEERDMIHNEIYSARRYRRGEA